jgi:hypothetical protein
MRVTILLAIILTITVITAPMAVTLAPTQAVRLRAVETSLITNKPTGLMAYTGPTSAVAGYYCLHGVMGSGWSIMLNAYLNNAYIIQDIIGSTIPIPLPILANYITNIWLINNTGARLVHVRQLPYAFACGWLVIRLVNGTAYIGFSIDGRHAIWFDSYHVGGGSIILASIVMGGDGDGSTAIINSGVTIPLALYYWRSSWYPVTAPTPVDINIEETVNNAWVSLSVNCSSVVSWPMPVSYTTCPNPPRFAFHH